MGTSSNASATAARAHPETAWRRWLGVEMSEASTREKLVAAVGGGLSILTLIGLSRWALPGAEATVMIASMGASAVLLFAVPHGPLSQPWPVVGGHGVSALIGVTCAHVIAQPVFAAASAVGLAIGVMYQLRCIHPPGGATALTAVLGGRAIRDLGFQFVLFPVLANAVAMVLLAVLINFAFGWRRYPAALRRSTAPAAAAPTHAEVLAAIRSLDSFIDIDETDLVRLATLLSNHPRTSRGAR